MSFYDRKATRIAGYDYSQRNYYFVTICTHDKKCIFGTVDQYSEFGMIAEQELRSISSHYNNVILDAWIVMPNHIHAVIVINGDDHTVKLTDVIGLYKSGVSRKIRMIRPNMKVWQRSFHDHIIRDQREYEKIWNYVVHNRQKWESDCFFVTE